MSEKKGEVKALTVRMENEIYKKMKIKAVLKDATVNEYITALITDDVADVDLSAFVKE